MEKEAEMQNPTIRKIVEGYLKWCEYDGLVNVDSECGCELDDLMPCDCESIEGCQAGYKVKCTKECDHDDSDISEWHIQLEKSEDSKCKK